ncbi:MAG TPA: hypothetical protein VGR46_03755 [Candidatus Limnocylindria bacterium]|nr:hypothetical protein [Candidatus Limnocylindria bacterium]
METLYFDLLQFLYHLALAVLVGGTLVLGTAVAPALFGPGGAAPREPPASTMRTQAGTLFGAVLARFDGYAILALVVLVVTSALKASFEVTGTPEPRLVARWIVLVLLALATLYSSAWANPVARSIRGATAGFDDLPAGAPARVEFARMHERSRRAMSIAAVFGLLALFLS